MPALVVYGSDGHPHAAAALDRWTARNGAPDLLLLGDEVAAVEWALDRGHYFVCFGADRTRYGSTAGAVQTCNLCVAAGPGAHCIGFSGGAADDVQRVLDLARGTGLEAFEVTREGVARRYSLSAAGTSAVR